MLGLGGGCLMILFVKVRRGSLEGREGRSKGGSRFCRYGGRWKGSSGGWEGGSRGSGGLGGCPFFEGSFLG